MVDWLSKIQNWPMLLNDSLGDCVWAMAGHALEAWSTYGEGHTITVTDTDVLQGYEDVTGYSPGDPATDQGTVIQDALAYWRTAGIGHHTILAYAQVDHTNPDEVKAALNVFGALLVGVNLPNSALTQFNNSEPWDVVLNDGGIAGGHAIHVGHDDTGALHAVTWGHVQPLTHTWWNNYVEEAWVAISPDWLSATGASPEGVDLYRLGEDYAALTGQSNPFPQPAPPGPPPPPVDVADQTLAGAARDWLGHHHSGGNAAFAAAVRAWLNAKHLL